MHPPRHPLTGLVVYKVPRQQQAALPYRAAGPHRAACEAPGGAGNWGGLRARRGLGSASACAVPVLLPQGVWEQASQLPPQKARILLQPQATRCCVLLIS